MISSSVHDGICAPGEKAHMRSTPSLKSLTDDGPSSSFQEKSSSASSFHASLLQAIDGVVSLALSGRR